MKVQKVVTNKIVYTAKFSVLEIEKALVDKMAQAAGITISSDGVSVQMTRMPDGETTVEITVDFNRMPIAQQAAQRINRQPDSIIKKGCTTPNCMYVENHHGECNIRSM